MYRQGDILLMPIPEETAPVVSLSQPRDARGRLVLSYGEGTGHAHAIPGPGTLSRGFLHLPVGGRLVHEEHAAISLPKGWYRVIRQPKDVPGPHRVMAG
ncbi:hypothetical protein ACGFJC_50395 [Nonomuraea fuscirosea]|jgi:hypothetical protein|uniref:Uncharacterized protein n=1 Tax=Nonomuraea fuscirosea TaxID=1291556 RepID=A0A2T0M4A4_9ACTN|nr:hypothetical protein [Nonomuraea fuscirosea]PRX51699.1 hypothetical protein B0I32_13555 [Nonomuraea fuscirosea]WSA49915.1 hypothetical protein OIE67_38470 [Nonomuraea fuscirosea]